MRSRAESKRQPWTLHKVHKWTGLAAALWLAVLGATGFLLDHRDWRWLWQDGPPARWLPDGVINKAVDRRVRLYQVDPGRPEHRLAGGPGGLWLSIDGGRNWSRPRFAGYAGQPRALALEPDPRLGWKRPWLGSDDGLWVSADGGAHFERGGLAGQAITALARGGGPDTLLGVVGRSRVFRLDTGKPAALAWLALAPPAPDILPRQIDLSRLVHDLHFGRGLFAAPASLLLSDAGALALVLLPLTGLAFWWLPRRWKRLRRRGTPVAGPAKGRVLRWLYRLHGPGIGLAGLLPILYLAATGVLIDHDASLLPWMRSVAVSRPWQPPVYDLGSWRGEIYGVAGYPGAPGRLALGTRSGLFVSDDGGRHWSREAATPGFVWTLRRIGANLFIGGMGSPNLVSEDGGPWRPARHTGGMPSDISALPGGGWAWIGARGGAALAWPPASERVPWFYVIDGLHSGLLIHPQWKWVNDLFALAALALAVTGLLRWWRHKWL